MDFLSYLQPSGLRAAYWKKAMETHPDRARALGRDEELMAERFKEINSAYNKLIEFLGKKGRLFPGPKKRTRPQKQRENAKRKYSDASFDRFYSGYMPKRELLIGQYLYYSGIVSWHTLIRAITWQRRQRPLFGQIAREWSMLSEEDIRWILRERHFMEKFGEFTLRTGLLNNFELMAVLGKQRRLQQPIGEYFLREGILRSRDMERLVEKQRVHNRNFLWRS